MGSSDRERVLDWLPEANERLPGPGSWVCVIQVTSILLMKFWNRGGVGWGGVRSAAHDRGGSLETSLVQNGAFIKARDGTWGQEGLQPPWVPGGG